MDPKGTFVLGVGAQKSGTSWLFDYFRTVDAFHPGFQKEYHILDAIYVPSMKGRYNDNLRTAADSLLNTPKKGRTIKILRRAIMTLRPSEYYDYFAHVLSDPDKSFTADMTPSHSALPIWALRKIQSEFADRNVHVKPIFLMRDPVERAWSALRMARRDRTLRDADFKAVGINSPYRLSDDALLRVLPEMPGYMARSNYGGVMQRLEKVFDTKDITYAFFEELFTRDCIADIAESIGFPYVEPNFDEVSNASPKQNALEEDTLNFLAQRYARVYKTCAKRFGDERVLRIWPHYARVKRLAS